MKVLSGCAILFALTVFSAPVLAATYYVRTDGGTAAQCNGTVNAPVSAAPNCAWASPTVALPMGDGQYGYTIPTALIKGGDTLVIASGSYMIGYAPTPIAGTQGQACNQSNPYECSITNIPSGIDAAHPTVITGDCSAPLPELWGTQRVNAIFSLSGQHDVTIACLEITDHSNCIDSYLPNSAYSCDRSTYPYGQWAATGIHADHVTNLTLRGLNIHGLADYGVNAGALSGNTLLDNVTLRGNGWGGYNGDLGGNNASSSDTGNITIQNSVIAWNGCTENYPSTTIFNCWGQQEGGYGDGLGESQTGGNWHIINTSFIGNTQDGLDLLYADGTGYVFVDRVTSMWNAGNQIKISGNSTIQNTVAVGACAYLKGWGAITDPDLCRASGAALSLSVTAPNQTINVLYSTIAGSGDCLINGGTHGGFTSPDSTDVYNYQNNVFLGAYYYRAGRNSCLDWYTDAATNPFTVNYLNNIVWNVKDNVCPAGSICKDPQLTNEGQNTFYAMPLVSSPAIGNASAAGTTVPLDYYGNPRPSQGATIGAVQYRGQAYLGGGNNTAPLPPLPKGPRSATQSPVRAADSIVPVTQTPRALRIPDTFVVPRAPDAWVVDELRRERYYKQPARFGVASPLWQGVDGGNVSQATPVSHPMPARVASTPADAANGAIRQPTLSGMQSGAMPSEAAAMPATAVIASAPHPAVSYWMRAYGWFVTVYHDLVQR